MATVRITEAELARDIHAVLAKAHEEKLGQAPTLDSDFAADVEEIIRNRKKRNPPEWD